MCLVRYDDTELLQCLLIGRISYSLCWLSEFKPRLKIKELIRSNHQYEIVVLLLLKVSLSFILWCHAYSSLNVCYYMCYNHNNVGKRAYALVMYNKTSLRAKGRMVYNERCEGERYFLYFYYAQSTFRLSYTLSFMYKTVDFLLQWKTYSKYKNYKTNG